MQTVFHKLAGSFWIRTSYDIISNLFVCSILIGISLILLSGNAPILIFIKNDFLTTKETLLFVFSWPTAYLFAWSIVRLQFSQIVFDWQGRAVLVCGLSFLTIAIALYLSRVFFLSRTVFLFELIIGTISLIVVLNLRARLFKSVFGVSKDDSSIDLPEHSGVRYKSVNFEESLPRGLSGLVVDLKDKRFEEDAARLVGWREAGLEILGRRDLFEKIAGRVLLSEVTLPDLEKVTPPKAYMKIKRIADFLIVLTFSPVCLALAIIIGFAVRFETPGPIFFTQRRIGLHGKEFVMFKFRSMFDLGTESIESFALKRDSRVTKVGRFIRRFRLDEIPQLVNVLKGDMSLIGPRPEQQSIVDKYLRSIPFYGFRHILRPGISGWAQVSYPYAASEAETKEKLEYDFFYIKNINFWVDFIILIRTFVTVLSGRGAR